METRIGSFDYAVRVNENRTLEKSATRNDGYHVTAARPTKTSRAAIPFRVGAALVIRGTAADDKGTPRAVLLADAMNFAFTFASIGEANQKTLTAGRTYTLSNEREAVLDKVEIGGQLQKVRVMGTSKVPGFDRIVAAKNRALLWRHIGGTHLYFVEFSQTFEVSSVLRIVIPQPYHPARRILADLSADGTTVLFTSDYLLVPRNQLQDEYRVSRLMSYTVGDTRVAFYETNGAAILSLSRIVVPDYPGGYGQFVVDAVHSQGSSRQASVFTGEIRSSGATDSSYPTMTRNESYRLVAGASQEDQLVLSEFVTKSESQSAVFKVHRVGTAQTLPFVQYKSSAETKQSVIGNELLGMQEAVYTVTYASEKDTKQLLAARMTNTGVISLFRSRTEKDLYALLAEDKDQDLSKVNLFKRTPVAIDFLTKKRVLIVYRDGHSETFVISATAKRKAPVEKNAKRPAKAKPSSPFQ